MKMRVSRLMLVPALMLAAGCMKGQRVIKVNADGSGTIVDTIKLGEQAKGMLASMEQMDKTPAAEKKAKKDGKLKAAAAAMGEGVTFVSLVDSKDGGEQITYAFKDVTKIKVDSTPNPSSNDSSSSSSKEEPLTFRFARQGANPLLTVVFPKAKPSTEKKPEPKPEEMQQAIGMMKGMMAGLRMTTLVEVNGKLIKTSSPWGATGNQVTLLDIDFDQLDEAGLKVLASSGSEPPSPAALKGVKGLKVNDGEVTIEFAK
jgi:hypothetical protein